MIPLDSFLLTMISKLLAQLIKRKFTAGILLLVIAGGGYWGYAKIFNNNGAIRYAAAQVQNGTLIVSISGSGQVSASNQVDVRPKTSGEITAVYVKSGQAVGAGAILAAIDASDAERAVRDAEISLETAKNELESDAPRAVRDAETALETANLELDQMLEPVDELTLLQAENSLDQAKKSKQKAEDNIKKAYEDGFNSVSSTFLDLPSIMAGLENTLFGKTIDNSQDSITWYI
ncbi:MAG: biotin/lipoyl-binding protein, partial [Candidatus Portnoybacteria bacterium]|nr:biotin/lipoyl-binding protein [Candidatus Portnoybacteria bacterium]